MSREIKVVLYSPDKERDVLSFKISEDTIIDVDLNDANCQNKLKEVFIALFGIQIEDDVVLELETEDGYPRVLYKDVCNEYINDLNNELVDVRRTIQKELL